MGAHASSVPGRSNAPHAGCVRSQEDPDKILSRPPRIRRLVVQMNLAPLAATKKQKTRAHELICPRFGIPAFRLPRVRSRLKPELRTSPQRQEDAEEK